jgi:hypothetical protein
MDEALGVKPVTLRFFHPWFEDLVKIVEETLASV